MSRVGERPALFLGLLADQPELVAEVGVLRWRASGECGTPGCDWPWRSAYVTHTGKVQPCCMVMGEERAVLGDVVAEDFSAVWRGRAYAEFRSALRSTTPPDVCRGCALYRHTF